MVAKKFWGHGLRERHVSRCGKRLVRVAAYYRKVEHICKSAIDDMVAISPVGVARLKYIFSIKKPGVMKNVRVLLIHDRCLRRDDHIANISFTGIGPGLGHSV